MNLLFRKCVFQTDINSLFRIANCEDQYLFSTRIPFNTEIAFHQWLERKLYNEFNDFFVIEDTSNQSIIGFVHNYDFSLIDGHCKICICIDKQYRYSGIGSIAAIKFLHILFGKYPLRKVYATVYSYNNESLKSNINAGFKEEGIIKNYRYYNGRFYDLHYLSLSRDSYKKLSSKTKEYENVLFKFM